MKDYATETDLIETPDPVFHIGDKVTWKLSAHNDFTLYVSSVAWDSIEQAWSYELWYFIDERPNFDDRCNNAAFAVPDAFEKDLTLVSRKQNTGKYTIINGKQVIFKK
jgi:hypothetical protein